MKFDIKKVVKRIPLREYADDYPEELAVHVWVNPPRDVLLQREQMDEEFLRMSLRQKAEEEKRLEELTDASEERKEELRREAEEALVRNREELEEFIQRSQEWFSEIWSQGPEGERWPVEDVKELAEKDPALSAWLFERTRTLMQEHITQQKKA